ncbi:MAG: hypothetical protein AB1810_06575 [Pseudomonadota bacterium]
MRKYFLVIIASVVLATRAWASGSEIDISGLTQTEFRDLSRELGLASSYKAVAPAEPLGVTGFDLGLELSLVDVEENTSYWDKSFDDIPDFVPVTKLRVIKGLPFNLDIGAFYSKIPSCDVRLWGGELKWAYWGGSAATPALAIRGFYTELQRVMGLDFNTKGIDVSISKGFANFTPYAGIGRVWIESDPTMMSLEEEQLAESRLFGGLQISFTVLKVVVEAELAEIPTYTVKFSAGF